MKKNIPNSIELFNSFSEKEIKQLKELASCRLFNSDKHVILLIDVLKKQAWQKNEFDSRMQKLVYEQVFSDLAPLNQLNIKQKNLLSSKLSLLTSLAEQLLTIQRMRKGETYKSEFLYPELLERKQYLLYEKHIRKSKQKFQGQTIKTVNDHEECQRTEQSVFEYLYLKEEWATEDNLNELVYNLDLYYLLKRLSLQLTALTLQRSHERTYDFPSQNNLSLLLKFPAYAGHPLIELYLASIRLMEAKTDEAYRALLALLEVNNAKVSRQSLIDFYKTGISYCVHAIRSGDLAYNKNMFDIYQIMHHENLILEKNNSISQFFFKNMIVIACRMEAYNWALEMNEYYQKYILAEIRSSVYHFNLGVIAFHQKDFDLAHSNLIRVEKFDLTFYTNARVLMLKCLYEKREPDYSEHTMTALRSAEKYFKEQSQLASARKTSYKNYIQILRMLYRIRYRVGKMTIEDVKAKLAGQKVFADKKWLLEKIAELEKK